MKLTIRRVWRWMSEGCNVAEIAAIAGVSRVVAQVWMTRAARKMAA